METERERLWQSVWVWFVDESSSEAPLVTLSCGCLGRGRDESRVRQWFELSMTILSILTLPQAPSYRTATQ
jgi:hypothetical protein